MRYFERQDGGFGKAAGDGRLGKGFVGGDAVGVVRQNGLAGGEGFFWMSAEGDLGFGQRGGDAGRAEHFLKKSFFSGVSFDLGNAEDFAGFVAGGRIFENVFQQGNGVVQIVAVKGLLCFVELFAQLRREGVGLGFRHDIGVDFSGEDSASVFVRRKIRPLSFFKGLLGFFSFCARMHLHFWGDLSEWVFCLRLWWNWQTRNLEVVVPKGVQVQVLLTAPFLIFLGLACRWFSFSWGWMRRFLDSGHFCFAAWESALAAFQQAFDVFSQYVCF